MIRCFLLIFALASLCYAEQKSKAGKRLNSDPKVVYVEDFTAETLKFRVKHESPVYSDKYGKRRIGRLKVGSICELIGFDHRAFKVKGEAVHGRFTGWVSPHALESKDPNMVENFKTFYEREVIVKQIIAEGEIAIGMSPSEVEQVLGKPTKKSKRITSTDSATVYEYLVKEEVKHYQTLQDPETREFYQVYSYSTMEITESITIDFVNNAVTVVQMDEDNSKRDKPRIVAAPYLMNWRNYLVR